MLGHGRADEKGWAVIELEVVGITRRPMTEEERQRMRDQVILPPGQPPPAPGAVVVDVGDEPRWIHEVRLKERDGDRVLVIGIGDAEALAIQVGLLDVDCRPSDGVALAIRLGVPIVAADEMEPVLAAA
jgi:hypothetical protein